MVTIDQLIEFLQRRTAECRLRGDHEGLRRVQLGAGLLMDAANYANDHATAERLKILAAKAANHREALEAE